MAKMFVPNIDSSLDTFIGRGDMSLSAGNPFTPGLYVLNVRVNPLSLTYHLMAYHLHY